MTIDIEEFGQYLRRLRESRGLSLRQAAAQAGMSSAYLSQVEGGKRGKRKKGDPFAPHPQILKKLADIYHVEPMGLLERAGYVEKESRYDGFSEEREIDRVFDFVIYDPAIKHVFTILDKRAIINRYEAITGRRLITWAGETQTPMWEKSDYKGLAMLGEILYAETVHKMLTVEEVARELWCSVDQVMKYIENRWLAAKKDPKGQLCVDKQELREFKDYAMHDGLRLRETCEHKHKPYTKADYRNAWIALNAPKPIPKIRIVKTKDQPKSSNPNVRVEKLQLQIIEPRRKSQRSKKTQRAAQ